MTRDLHLNEALDMARCVMRFMLQRRPPANPRLPFIEVPFQFSGRRYELVIHDITDDPPESSD